MKRDYVLFENPNRDYSDYVAVKWNGGDSFTVFYLSEEELQEPSENGSWTEEMVYVGGTYTAQELIRQIPYMNLPAIDEEELKELLFTERHEEV